MASSPVVTTAGSVVVVTHVIPAPQVAAAQNAARNKLRRGHVVALGSVLSGSLTVAAEKFNNCAVKGAMGFSVVAAVTSAGATAIYFLDAFDVIWNLRFNHCYYSYYNGDIYWIRTTAVSGVLAGVSVLEFIISICVLVIVCDASRQSMDQQPTVITNQSHEATTQTSTLPTYEPPPVSQPPTTIPERSFETMRPLEYNMI
uniref:uncharacterized protein LOC117265956 isoform X3 n=1 Tax=Epinephelus lanceolatus TaxID=310571 RepID=UPI001446C84E|nr:uncharacterized protein LOC117265956 isoform X3 [Epinephelus lanceolatus]